MDVESAPLLNLDAFPEDVAPLWGKLYIVYLALTRPVENFTSSNEEWDEKEIQNIKINVA